MGGESCEHPPALATPLKAIRSMGSTMIPAALRIFVDCLVFRFHQQTPNITQKTKITKLNNKLNL